MLISDLNFLADKIQEGSICVIPTDTVYGLVASVNDPELVDRVYDIKGRTHDKPFIILISDMSQLAAFSIELSEEQTTALHKLWPGPVSVILKCPEESFFYLHRGYDSLAFRLPDQVWLRELISRSGPIIATSANKSGYPPSDDINQIINQLPTVDLYIEGPVGKTPSKLARLTDEGKIEWVERQQFSGRALRSDGTP